MAIGQECFPQSQATSNRSEGADRTKSFKVRKRALVPLFVVTTLLIGGIVALVALSSVNHGFVRVKNTSSNFAYIDWTISLTWIVVPSIIFQVYGLCVAAVIDAFGFRQPFVELARGAAAEKSIALDYASFFPVQREWKAFRNGHWHIGVPFAVSLLLKIVIGPLAARMIVEQPHSSTKPVQLTHDYAFVTTSSVNGPLGWDLEPVLGAASSTKIKSWNENTSAAIELRPEWWASFEQQLHQVGSVDPSTSYGNADFTNGVGRLILDYARQTSSDPFDASTLIEASQEVYATVYATLLNTFMIRPTEQPVEVPGKLTRTRNELFIVNAIAGVILGFLLTVAAILILIYSYTESRPSVLFEEPVGILGFAGLAVNGIVCRMTEGIRSLEGYSGKTSKNVLTKIKLIYGPTAAFEMVDSADPRRAHIEVWPDHSSGKETSLPFMQNRYFRGGSRVHDDQQEPGPEKETRSPLTISARQTSTERGGSNKP
ncbi:hypothetical protein LTR70_005420 [Exophiala xenobiotica]|uniref:Uncharacterized protein n=1 Tax=Lithohypha guttulata TaxID=1690604 RepID=A0ABR0K9Q1_9EURO|nr:hypothetical protein LTR24_005162 [Lithohypha guttulata]KAK5318398.1 hypothetical protein LTR70_005420 [Exophiala xenobiotica]